MSKAYIVSAVRTPIGSFGGSLSSLSATQLGSHAVKVAISTAGIDPKLIEEVYLGNVVSANLGQAPARQAALGAGLSLDVPCTTVNKVCASGMKSIMLAAQTIELGHADVVVAGGFESMSNIPYYVPKARFGYKFGGSALVDGLENDGLKDAYDQVAMGVSADQTAAECSISREMQDEYAINSYKKAAKATESGRFRHEIAPISIPQRRGDDLVIDTDEEFTKVKFEKIPSLRPVFTKDGTVTAANASTINDGASALIVVSEKFLKQHKLTPLARIAGYADAAREPMRFPLAPTLAAPKALKRAGIKAGDVSASEVNEAFAMVPLSFTQEVEVDPATMNINGGAVSLGHPLGMSGARIVGSLAHELKLSGGKHGLAAICNGGGGASALVLEKV
jgi:acetyl-CoA C-acetyltransferase